MRLSLGADMNIEILKFLKEMKEKTEESFLYQENVWQFNHREEEIINYAISSTLNGFSEIKKETQEELINAFPLIRKLVEQLTEVRKTHKRIETKMLNQYISED